MKTLFSIKNIAAYALLTGTSGAFSHDGHGLGGSHWHATDAWGFAAIGAMIAVAIWLTRK